MSTLTAIAIRTSVILLAGLALHAALRRRSSALRHAVVALSLLGAALVAPVSTVLPSWGFVVPALQPAPSVTAPFGVLVAIAPTTQPSRASSPSAVATDTRSLAAPIWAAGFIAVLAMLVAGLARLRQIAACGVRVNEPDWTAAARDIASTYGLRHDVVLIASASPLLVATWGLRPAHVLLPPDATDWSEARIRAVLSHELAHVARADWAVQIGSQIVLAVLWFNPLAWLACRQLRRDSEQACDDAVLRRGVAGPEYAGHVLALARSCRRPSWSSWMPALPMARPSAFERRIAAMLNPHLDRRPLSRAVATAFAAALVALTSAVASARPGQGPGNLSGTVYDPSGGIIPGVTLTLSAGGQRTNLTADRAVTVTESPHVAVQATTDSGGRFSFSGVAPGRYVLSAALPGFHELHEEFDLKAASDWDRMVTLQIGTLRETISVSATRTFAAAPAGPTPVRVGGNIRVPVKLLDVKPIYPESMRAEGREAEVQLEATIGRDGAVSAVHVLSSQIHPDFAVAATDAVRQWRFRPTLLNGTAIDVVMTVTVRFSLAD